jgi:hypothetical protein
MSDLEMIDLLGTIGSVCLFLVFVFLGWLGREVW